MLVLLFSLLGASGFFFGLFLARMTHEELEKGQKYFVRFGQALLVLYGIGLLAFSLSSPLLFLLSAGVCVGLLTRASSKVLFSSIPYAAYLSPVMVSVVFFYGLVWAARVAQVDSHKVMRTAYTTLGMWPLLVFFLLAIASIFF